MSLGHGASIAKNGLLMHLDAGNTKSYPGSGTSCTDLSGNGINGVLTNGATVSNGAFVFDGVDDHVSMGDVLDITGSFSLNVWFKGNTTQPDQYVGILNKDVSGSFGNYGLYGDVNSSYVRFGFVSSTAQREINNSSFLDIKSNEWVNYCGTYDQSFMRLYRNGVQIASLSMTETPVTNNTVLALGGRVGTANYFSGQISIGQVYSRGLTAAEVTQNFNAHRGRYGI